ncbi:MAG: hypothetical protein DHS20C02_14410 [Micavibrio sp.]|nr:MAG: hypothetical protein DHS20C02_14410 [Micavibrio sp.]
MSSDEVKQIKAFMIGNAFNQLGSDRLFFQRVEQELSSSKEGKTAKIIELPLYRGESRLSEYAVNLTARWNNRLAWFPSENSYDLSPEDVERSSAYQALKDRFETDGITVRVSHTEKAFRGGKSGAHKASVTLGFVKNEPGLNEVA